MRRLFMGPNHLEGGRISMTQFANALTNILGKPVIDKTSFTGTFDVKLDFAPEGTALAGAPGRRRTPTPPAPTSSPRCRIALE